MSISAMRCKDCGNTHPALPGFPNHVLCDYYRLHMSNLADASRCEHFKAKVLTNADCIRVMTDEELADYAYKALGNYCCPPGREHATRTCIIDMKEDCDNCWLDWLRQEATL